jgi:tetratricopeptide (TPR) repeat protein
MTETPPPAGHSDPASREDLWHRIAVSEITPDIAREIWLRLSQLSVRAGNGPCDVHTLDDFQRVVTDIGRVSTAQERMALMELVDLQTQEAECRYECVVAQAGERQPEVLWRKAALFAPTHPQVARHALERLLALEPQQVYARYTLGTLLQRLNRDDEAEAHFLHVVSHTATYPELQVEALERLGYMAMARDHCRDAQSYFERALELHRALAHDTGVLAILHELAVAAERTGDIARAQQYLEQVRCIHEKNRNDVAAAIVLTKIARLASFRGDLASARPLIRRALPLLERQDCESAVAYEFADAGDVARLCGDTATAERAYERTRRLSYQVDDELGLARALEGLGHLASDREDYGDAEWLLRNASTLYDSAGSQSLSAQTLMALGSAYYEDGNPSAARESWERALARFDAVGMTDAATQLRETMAYARTG